MTDGDFVVVAQISLYLNKKELLCIVVGGPFEEVAVMGSGGLY